MEIAANENRKKIHGIYFIAEEGNLELFSPKTL